MLIALRLSDCRFSGTRIYSDHLDFSLLANVALIPACHELIIAVMDKRNSIGVGERRTVGKVQLPQLNTFGDKLGYSGRFHRAVPRALSGNR